MVDMSQTIAPKSNQLNSDDLIAGPRTIRITKVSANPGSAEQPVAIYFEGDNGKPFYPCKTIRRVLVTVWGPDAVNYAGRSLTIYRDPEVQFGGMKVGGIRVSHMSHIDKAVTMVLTASKQQRKPYTVKPLVDAPKQAPQAAATTSDTPKYVAKLNEDAKPWGIKFRDAPNQAAVNELLADPDWQELQQELEQHSPDMLARIAKHFTKGN